MLKKILFVDDEPNFLDGIRRMLRDQREVWELYFAGGVDEALRIVHETSMDAIITDINMPGRDGFQLLQALRESPVAQDVPVVVLTGNAQTDMKRRALDLGATDLLNKPVDKEELLARVRSVLRMKAFQDQIKHQNLVLEERVRERTFELEHSRLDIVWRLAKAGEYRDEETGNHVVRVACFSKVLSEGLGMPRGFTDMLFITSPLHDIGKIGVPDGVLLKRGRLDEAERRIIEQHTEIGAAILEAAPKGQTLLEGWQGGISCALHHVQNPMLEMGKVIALNHHEKWTGGGYPRGISGESIPLEGRIVAVADVYDALRAARPYKPAFDEEKTLAIMQEEASHRFDPAVFAVFLSKLNEFQDIIREYGHAEAGTTA